MSSTSTVILSDLDDEKDWDVGTAPPFHLFIDGPPVFFCEICMKKFLYHFAVVQHANDKHSGRGIPSPIPKKG